MRNISGLPELIFFFAAQSKGAYCDHPSIVRDLRGDFWGVSLTLNFRPTLEYPKNSALEHFIPSNPTKLPTIKRRQSRTCERDSRSPRTDTKPSSRFYCITFRKGWRPRQSEYDAATVCTKYVPLLTDDHAQARLGGR